MRPSCSTGRRTARPASPGPCPTSPNALACEADSCLSPSKNRPWASSSSFSTSRRKKSRRRRPAGAGRPASACRSSRARLGSRSPRASATRPRPRRPPRPAPAGRRSRRKPAGLAATSAAASAGGQQAGLAEPLQLVQAGGRNSLGVPRERDGVGLEERLDLLADALVVAGGEEHLDAVEQAVAGQGDAQGLPGPVVGPPGPRGSVRLWSRKRSRRRRRRSRRRRRAPGGGRRRSAWKRATWQAARAGSRKHLHCTRGSCLPAKYSPRGGADQFGQPLRSGAGAGRISRP